MPQNSSSAKLPPTMELHGREKPSEIETRDPIADGAPKGSPYASLRNIMSRIPLPFLQAKPPASEERERDEAEEIDRSQTVIETLMPEEAESTPPLAASKASKSNTSKPLSRPTSDATNAPTRKHPRERDTYEIMTSPESNNEEEVHSDRSNKRIRIGGKAKKPIIAPKRSNGNPSTVATRSSHRYGVAETTTSEDNSALPIQSPLNGNRPLDGSPIQPVPVKRGRGRPRKNPASGRVVNAVVSEVSPTGDGHDILENNLGSEAPAVQLIHPSPSTGDGATEMLMNPSTIRTSQQVRPARISGAQTKSHTGSLVQKPDVNLERSEGLETEDGDSSDSSEGNEDTLIEISYFKEMVNKAERVGHSLKSGQWEQVHSENTRSSNGKKMEIQLNLLLAAYEDLQNTKASGDSDTLRNAQASILSYISKLEDETVSILATKLGNPNRRIEITNKDKTKRMLKDLYFNIIPLFVRVVQRAAEAYGLERSTETFAVEEVLVLVTMLDDLASTAVMQPPDTQPKPDSKSHTYHTQKPARELVPMIRQVKRIISKELQARNRAAKAAEFERMRSERERKRAEREQRENAENRHRRKAIHRQQNQALKKRLSEPLWGQILRHDIAQEEAKVAAWKNDPAPRASSDKNSQRHTTQPVENEDDYDPLEDEEYQRVSVFGKHNTNNNNRSRPWSKEEKALFIEYMRYEHGDNRYEMIANKLERSMDEIFACAKDFQEAMDHEHEKGNMNLPCDEWTYDIWVDTSERN